MHGAPRDLGVGAQVIVQMVKYEWERIRFEHDLDHREHTKH
jgi:hypothetical protein